MHCNFCLNRKNCDHSEEEVCVCNEYCYIVFRKNYYYKIIPFQELVIPFGEEWSGEVMDE